MPTQLPYRVKCIIFGDHEMKTVSSKWTECGKRYRTKISWIAVLRPVNIYSGSMDYLPFINCNDRFVDLKGIYVTYIGWWTTLQFWWEHRVPSRASYVLHHSKGGRTTKSSPALCVKLEILAQIWFEPPRWSENETSVFIQDSTMRELNGTQAQVEYSPWKRQVDHLVLQPLRSNPMRRISAIIGTYHSQKRWISVHIHAMVQWDTVRATRIHSEKHHRHQLAQNVYSSPTFRKSYQKSCIIIQVDTSNERSHTIIAIRNTISWDTNCLHVTPQIIHSVGMRTTKPGDAQRRKHKNQNQIYAICSRIHPKVTAKDERGQIVDNVPPFNHDANYRERMHRCERVIINLTTFLFSTTSNQRHAVQRSQDTNLNGDSTEWHILSGRVPGRHSVINIMEIASCPWCTLLLRHSECIGQW